VLAQLRALAEELEARPLANLGLEADLEALCESWGAWTNTPVSFESNVRAPLPLWVGRPHTLCLDFFVEQALGYACAASNQVSVVLEVQPEGLAVSVCFMPSAASGAIPPHLQEWLRAWGGRLDDARLANGMVDLTAWMGADKLS
jgi:hypothetical protein